MKHPNSRRYREERRHCEGGQNFVRVGVHQSHCAHPVVQLGRHNDERPQGPIRQRLLRGNEGHRRASGPERVALETQRWDLQGKGHLPEK